jgi:hypothetical protein
MLVDSRFRGNDDEQGKSFDLRSASLRIFPSRPAIGTRERVA